MNNNYFIYIWIAIAVVAFAILWKQGQLLRLSNYIQETREELKKCTWPTWAELKGSTLVVMICIALIAIFTIVVDFVFASFVRWVS
ncbi:preprotein translocase subunit SecE [Pedosphaera parvula]|uniref:Protein translocase subunit SecE n=1 Tax=Pedosphaera parvula (strain Ellin514) TaxID=320771 RepID=B9XFP4_PEDPL|nr:preprotein translocase subunit SecE [Pedosphaera parvula]EEF61408.1 preprotein translocase, SecE subunit [Pedosphaera parvula Ellin514]